MTLRVDPRGSVELVLPPGASERQGRDFLRSRNDWLERQLAALAPCVPFAHGSVVPVFGESRILWGDPAGRGRPRLEADRLVVPGAPAELANRTRRWLVTTASETIARRVDAAAATIGRPVAGVTIRDTRSRWGSCSARGTLSFSWRLVMAPTPVLDYVVAHEVAHLVEMNHSGRFWTIVAGLCPDHRRQRRWLREQGASLHRYG